MVGFGRFWLAGDDCSAAHAGVLLSWVSGVTSRSPAVGVDGVGLAQAGWLDSRAASILPGWLDQNFFPGAARIKAGEKKTRLAAENTGFRRFEGDVLVGKWLGLEGRG